MYNDQWRAAMAEGCASQTHSGNFETQIARMLAYLQMPDDVFNRIVENPEDRGGA